MQIRPGVLGPLFLSLAVAVPAAVRAQALDDRAVTQSVLSALYQVRSRGTCPGGRGIDCVLPRDECMQHSYTYAATLRRALGMGGRSRMIDIGSSAIRFSAAARGCTVNQLSQAIASGELRPGMLVHTKAHWFVDAGRAGYESATRAGHRLVRRHATRGRPDTCDNDAHHWAIYVGKDARGVPRFADNITFGRAPCRGIASAADAWRCTQDLRGYASEIGPGWANARAYGQAPDGRPPLTLPVRVYAIHDPLAGRRSAQNVSAPACAAAARSELAAAGGARAVPACVAGEAVAARRGR